jgi:hypothetical protein
MDAFWGLEHDDFAGGFGAPHTFYWQVIDAHGLKATNTGSCTFFDQRGCALNDICSVGARFRRVYDYRVRAGKIFQMEPHGVLRCLFDECVILSLVCADLDRVVAVENLGVHHDGDDVTYKNLNQFLHIENIDLKSIFAH